MRFGKLLKRQSKLMQIRTELRYLALKDGRTSHGTAHIKCYGILQKKKRTGNNGSTARISICGEDDKKKES
jgi:predicted amino acid dehydrogenase